FFWTLNSSLLYQRYLFAQETLHSPSLSPDIVSSLPSAPLLSSLLSLSRPVPLSYRLLDGQDTLPPVVFLHGLLSNKNIFQYEAETLAQKTGRKVLTVDARNHGESPHNPDCSYEAMSADLQDLLPKLGLTPCVVIGHSMGGKTAMVLALQKVVSLSR
uniref:sn-1-specific diacylglycerol lipase ABHD11 n=1 Tax=Monodelphis domestica TaxID=13616 RepID=F6SDK7_MONDO